MSSILNVIIGLLGTAVTVLAVIWVYNKFVGSVGSLGKGPGLGLGGDSK